MTKTQEALKLALEGAANYIDVLGGDSRKYRQALAEQPEFIKHEVENADDWSEWVCPEPKSYLMKCCDCGLVHEAQFGVVRYKSETEREDCEPVEDPNLQAVFRMRRSEQWSPKDTAHRAGGLPMEQPAQQEPVALDVTIEGDSAKLLASMLEPVLEDEPTPIRLLVGNGHSGHGLYVAAAEYQEEGAVLLVNTSPPASKPWVGLTDEEVDECYYWKGRQWTTDELVRHVEAKLREKNAPQQSKEDA